ncbi:SCNN1D [Bugula neritina]|uniref:SCNN1D n=1 Tax=Bugula neritina TaxID=10212 RepID=A0A7J7KK43_BUGNE|nr:SCNN1D [Bugula neritina]
MKEKFGDVLADFAETTTAHAPPKIMTHKHILSKLFWGFLFLIGIGTFVFFSQELIRSFVSFETTTDIELKFSVLEFPAVTFCNQNQFRADRVPEDIQTLVAEFLEAKRADMFGGKDKYDSFRNPALKSGRRRKKRSVEYALTEQEITIVEDMEGFYHPPNADDFQNMSWFDNYGDVSSEKSILLNLTQYISQYTEEDLIEAGHDIGEMLQECVFMGKTCGPEDFYHFYDNKYGNCYTFNSGMDKAVARITNPGTSFGMNSLFNKMVLYIQNFKCFLFLLVQLV